jgi:hypothetical protein
MMIFKKLAVYLAAFIILLIELRCMAQLQMTTWPRITFLFGQNLVGAFVMLRWLERKPVRRTSSRWRSLTWRVRASAAKVNSVIPLLGSGNRAKLATYVPTAFRRILNESFWGVNAMQKKPQSATTSFLMCCASFGAWCAFELSSGSSWQFVAGATVVWALVMCLVVGARLRKRKTA